VCEALDLSAILATYTEERGYPPYHPGMLVALLLYGYSRGVHSSRQLARACEGRVDFMAATGLNRADFRTIGDFRKRHLKALGELFVQMLRLCRAAGGIAAATDCASRWSSRCSDRSSKSEASDNSSCAASPTSGPSGR
jgi:transposase